MGRVHPNIVYQLSGREHGNTKASNELQTFAEHKAAASIMKEMHIKFPQSTRSAFLMSFSPDCTKVASTHGNHKVYVSDIVTGKTLHTLEGHPRTPWCLAFHPTCNQILASGCLGGEVRIWDLKGGSAKWKVGNGDVIASLTFHPFLQLIVIASGTAIYFWDWKDSTPHAWCKTNSELERVRFVKFDSIGQNLITGISNDTPVLNNSEQSSSTETTVSSEDENSGTSRPMRIGALSQLITSEEPPEISRDSVTSYILSRGQNARPRSEMPPGLPDVATDHFYNTYTSSGEFWITFLRLRSICFSLEKRLLYHRQMHLSTESDAGFNYSARSSSTDFENFSRFMSGADDLAFDAANRTQYANLISMLARIRTTLRFSSLSVGVESNQTAPTTASMSDIQERQNNAEGFRQHLNILKRRIFEAVARVHQTGYAGLDRQRFDLRFCLWLVEMALELIIDVETMIQNDIRRLNGETLPPPTEQQLAANEESTEVALFDRLNIDLGNPQTYTRVTTINANVLNFGGSGRASVQYIPLSGSLRRNLSQQFAAVSARRYESLGRRMRLANEIISASIRHSNDNTAQGHNCPSPLTHAIPRLLRSMRRTVSSSPTRNGSPDPPAVFVRLIGDTSLSVSTSNATSQAQDEPESPRVPADEAEDPTNTTDGSSPYFIASASFTAPQRDPERLGYRESVNQTHRIQSWKFTGRSLPEIYDASSNLVVRRCLIHNDASIDISQDGEKLVALIPPDDYTFKPFIFGVFSLKPESLGEVLCTWGFVSTAISVSFSPLANYIVVGLASSNPTVSNPEREAVAHIVELRAPKTERKLLGKVWQSTEAKSKHTVRHHRVLTQQITNDRHSVPASLNSIRWLPVPGQGMAYATNRGCLSICRPKAPMFLRKYIAVTNGSRVITQSSGISLGVTVPE